MTRRPPPGARFLGAPPPAWFTQIVDLPPDFIQFVCVVFEGYENLAMVRTPIRGRGRIYVTGPESAWPTTEAVLRDLARDIPLRLVEKVDRLVEDTW